MSALQRMQHKPHDAHASAWIQLLQPHLPALSYEEASLALSALLHFGRIPPLPAGPGRALEPGARLALPPLAKALMQGQGGRGGGFEDVPTELLLLLVRAFAANGLPLPADTLQVSHSCRRPYVNARRTAPFLLIVRLASTVQHPVQRHCAVEAAVHHRHVAGQP